MCVGGGGGGSEISKVRNSIPYESLDNVYLHSFSVSGRKEETSEAKNLCVSVDVCGGRGHPNSKRMITDLMFRI